jgi:tropinone reductase I
LNSIITLQNRRSIITGATRGIGRSITEMFLAHGASVIAVSRSDTDLAELRRVLVDGERVTEDRVRVVAADVSTSEGRERVRTAALTTWGAVDVLVNNVGTNIRKATVAYSQSEIETITQTNLDSAFELCRAFHPLLMVGNDGAIVNISSVASRQFMGSGVVYAMNKAAMDQMTRYLACEWAPQRDARRAGVRVNTVAPWYTRTPLVEPVLSNPDRLKLILERTPMGRIGEPEEIAPLVAFLASTAASYITGQWIAVDGGVSGRLL